MPGTRKHVPVFAAPLFARLAVRGDVGDFGALTQVFLVPAVQAHRPAPVGTPVIAGCWWLPASRLPGWPPHCQNLTVPSSTGDPGLIHAAVGVPLSKFDSPFAGRRPGPARAGVPGILSLYLQRPLSPRSPSAMRATPGRPHRCSRFPLPKRTGRPSSPPRRTCGGTRTEWPSAGPPHRCARPTGPTHPWRSGSPWRAPGDPGCRCNQLLVQPVSRTRGA